MAEAAKPGLKDEMIKDKFLRCFICLETFNNPKVLPCQHTFCLHCLDSYIEKNSTDGEFGCPCCRTITKVPNNGAAEFIANHFMNSLVDFFCGEKKGHLCSVCSFQNKTAPAVSKCVDCSDYLCTACSGVHLQTRLTRNHRVVPLDEPQASFSTSEITAKEHLPCPEHKMEIVQLYCTNCNKAICSSCKASTHLDHTCRDIDEAAKDRKPFLLDTLQELKQKSETALTNVIHLERYRDEIKLEHDLFHEEVRRISQSLQNCVSDMESQVTQDAETMAKHILELNDVALNESKTVLAKLFSHKEHLAKIIERGVAVEILKNFAMPTDAHRDTRVVCSEKPTPGQYKFANCGKKKKFLLDCQKSLQDIANSVRLEPKQGVVNKESSFVEKISNPQNSQCTGITMNNDGDIYVCCGGKIYLYSKNGKWKNLTSDVGVTSAYDLTIAGKTLIISTAGETDMPLKTVDDAGEHLELEADDSEGEDLALEAEDSEGEDLALETVDIQCTIVLYDIVKKSSVVITLDIFDSCPKICFDLNSSSLFITETSKHSIWKLNLDGSVVTKWTDPDNKGLSDITEDEHGNILVSSSKCIYGLDEDLMYAKGIGTSVANPNGIQSDFAGNIYVAIAEQNLVCLISTGGDFSNTILSSLDGIFQPYTLSVTGDRLAVGHGHGVWIYSLD